MAGRDTLVADRCPYPPRAPADGTGRDLSAGRRLPYPAGSWLAELDRKEEPARPIYRSWLLRPRGYGPAGRPVRNDHRIYCIHKAVAPPPAGTLPVEDDHRAVLSALGIFRVDRTRGQLWLSAGSM